MKVRKNYGILYNFFDKSVQNTLEHFAFIVQAVCKLLLDIQEYDFDLDSSSTLVGGSHLCTFVTSNRSISF